MADGAVTDGWTFVHDEATGALEDRTSDHHHTGTNKVAMPGRRQIAAERDAAR